MDKNRASNRHQRRIHSLRRKAIKAFREQSVTPMYDRVKHALLAQLKLDAFEMAQV